MKKSTIFLVLALVAVLVLALVGYNGLKDRVGREELQILGDTQPSRTEETTEPTTTEPTTTEPTTTEPTTTTPATTAPAENTEPTETGQSTETARELAPDFQVLNQQGETVRLSDLRGKPVVLNFWASWCGPCKMEMPEFQEAWEELGTEVHFMMVNLTDGTSETVEGVTDFLSQQGYSFPVYFDTIQAGAMAYGVSSVPVTYFIDPEGYLVAYGLGALDRETLQRGIDMIR